jgi:hypothetical protein
MEETSRAATPADSGHASPPGTKLAAAETNLDSKPYQDSCMPSTESDSGHSAHNNNGELNREARNVGSQDGSGPVIKQENENDSLDLSSLP